MKQIDKIFYVATVTVAFFAGVMVREASDQELIRIYEETIENKNREKHYYELMTDQMRDDLIRYQMAEGCKHEH